MGKLIYTATTSLDGYVEDQEGNLDWGAPDEERFPFVNEVLRGFGTFLFGRRMYETMLYWETASETSEQSAAETEFTQIWRGSDKIVYSKTLETVSSARTRIEREFDAEVVRQMKSRAPRDISVGGPELAAQAIDAGLVDEFQLFIVPIVLGGRKRGLQNKVPAKLELLDERRFTDGTMYLHYRAAT